MRDLNALDPLPALGAKVEKIEPLTEAEEKALIALTFEAIPHNFAVSDGRFHRVTEADCQQRAYSLGVWQFFGAFENIVFIGQE